MAGIIGERANIGDAIVDYEDKVFEDIQAEPGEKAYIHAHRALRGFGRTDQHAHRHPAQPKGDSTPTWCCSAPAR